MAGWMGAKERQMKPYLSFYHDKGIDTLSFAVGPNHVLFPNEAKKQMNSVLRAAHVHDEKNQISKPRYCNLLEYTIRNSMRQSFVFQLLAISSFLRGGFLVWAGLRIDVE